LGVDPGTRLAGFAVLVVRRGLVQCLDLGVIVLPAGWTLPKRLARLSHEMSRLVRQHKPQGVAVEQAIYAQNIRTALVLGQARGVVVGAAALAGAEVFEYSPREVKRAVTGNGAASKQQVQGMVRRLLALGRHPGADEADAAALALCHLDRSARAQVELDSAAPRSVLTLRARRSSRWTAGDLERLRAEGRIR
jgi:crossover junction endodeoxyribonuclease RuvC